MSYRSSIPGVLGLGIALQLVHPAPAADVDFQRDIMPLMADRCFACHGPDANQRKAGLRLDTEAGAKAEVIVPGVPDQSELLRRILTDDPDDRMPPPESEKAPLTAAEAEKFRAWIADGATWAGHWAFTPPKAADAPAVKPATWARTAVDPFILAAMEREGFEPAPEASRETLIRRLSLDLTGLPPTLRAIDRFVRDTRPDAYERLVDRTLADPAYGEHLARMWLDGARYADTNGYQNDFHRVMWPWRDWVVGAFNDNMPYDQFVVEQIAGDLLPNATESQRIATGFNRNNKSVTEGGSIEEEWLVENLVDRVETTSTVFLGLSMGCARCHDHKYDPISQREFYEFYAFFNSTEDRGFYEEVRGNTGPQVYLPSFEQQQALARHDQEIAEARKALAAARKAQHADFDAWLNALREHPPEAVGPTPAFEAALAGSLPAAGSSTPKWTQGPLSEVLALDGTAASTIDLGQAIVFDRDTPFTAGIWVKPDGPGALFSKMDESNAHRGVDALVTGNGTIEAHVISQWDGNALKIMAEKALEMGQWSHVAVTYDGSSKAAGLRVLVNGAPVPAKVVKDSLNGPIGTVEPLRIGQRTDSSYLKGNVTGFHYDDAALAPDALRGMLDATLAAALPETIEKDSGLDTALRWFHAQRIDHAVRPQRDAVDAAQRERNEYAKNVPSVMVMQEREEPRPTYLLKRGAYDAPDKSEQLHPGTPAFLPAMAEGQPRNRLGLAQWLVSPDQPLTARVAVNRFWQLLFGKGLVRTAEDFGLQGSPPTHPELLDTLAARFMASGWNVKGLLKELVMSATYRQSSATTETLLAADPGNRFYTRAPRYRLSAEMIRDNALAVSGLLSGQMGGPPAMPYQPDGLWEELAGGASQGPYKQGEGEDLYRRSIYTHRKRTVPHPTLTTFDAPSFEYCIARRSRTNTPLQALALLNDTTYVEAARHLAERMVREGGDAPDARATYGFRLATGREPSASERESLTAGLTQYLDNYRSKSEAAIALVGNGDSAVTPEVDRTSLAAYMTLASVILNLDEVITRE